MQIHENGFWLNKTTEGHVNDDGLKNALLDLLKTEGVATLLDLGCGPGYYIKAFKEEGILCTGFDGNPNTPQLTDGLGSVLDLSREFSLNTKYDCVLSLEVGEHIPELFEATVIENIAKHSSRLVIVSWAIPGQAGNGHVNCKANEQIETSFKAKGFLRLFNHEKLLRESAEYPWFKDTIMVFSKQPSLNKNVVTFDSYRDFRGYVINLDRERHRYDQARQRLTRAGFTNIHRWEATDYKKEDVNTEMRHMGVGHLERFRNDAELAVALSHMRVLAHFLSSKEEYCLIFEDDVIMHPEFSSLSDFNDIHYGDFDLLSFGGVFVGYDKSTLQFKNLQQLKKMQRKDTHIDDAVFWQAHAYMVSRKFAYTAIGKYREWTNSEEYHYPQWDEYFTRAPWFKTKLITNQTSTEMPKYRLYTMQPDNVCGIICQDNGYVSTIQNY